MAKSYKVLGQSAPSATTDTSLYTVPASTEVVISSLTVANRSTSAATFRVAVRPDGASIADQHYVAYDVPIGANSTVALTLGITADASDVITVRASTADLTFCAFGSEVSA